jgi:hypothetical protein
MKGALHQTGTRLARALRPKKHSVQRLGILVLSVCALIGVSRATNIKKLVLGSPKLATAGSPAINTGASSAVTTSAQTTTESESATSGPSNIVDLVSESEYIIRGLIKEVTDGFENGVPYTQVTMQVSEAIRGQVGEEYSFRQFGLTQPRKMENGKVYLGVTPEGWSKYKQGEEVVLFLYKQASLTGLRTTVGLGQGKLEVNGANIASQFGNEGLFENVEVKGTQLDDRDKRLLATKKGPVNAESFVSFVRRAVKDKWIEGGKMRHVKK